MELVSTVTALSFDNRLRAIVLFYRRLRYPAKIQLAHGVIWLLVVN